MYSVAKYQVLCRLSDTVNMGRSLLIALEAVWREEGLLDHFPSFLIALRRSVGWTGLDSSSKL
jgi:hypothetical protein